MTRWRRTLWSVIGLCLLAGGDVALGAEWRQLDIESTSTYVRWYRPDSLSTMEPAPMVIFLHGAGSTPEAWMPLLEEHAEAGAFVLALPKSISDFGWGVGRDHETLRLLIAALSAETVLAGERIGLAGHSSGGAFAYVSGLGGRLRVSSVFSLSAPFRTVLDVGDLTYTPPVRLYYGTEDPNFRILPPLNDMLDRLGVDQQQEVRPGFGHSSWPDSTLPEGFAFLLENSYPGPCVPTPTRLCLLNGRFAVELTWRDHQDREGVGSAADPQTTDSGLLYFFAEDNWEFLVKVLDGCGVNGHFWVFAAAATDIEFTLRVFDLQTGEEAAYPHPLGTPAMAINDSAAFATCP